METAKQSQSKLKMSAERRSSSGGTLCSVSSGRSSRARSSLGSSLEEALVREYNERFGAAAAGSSPSAARLPRKYVSPYASKGSRDGGTKRRSAPVTPDPSPPSSASARNGSRRRPHSSPSPQLRKSRPPSRATPPVYERQPTVIRVTAHRNGCGQASAKIAAPSFTVLLEECTSKLKMASAARRLFLEDGREASRGEDVPKDAHVYVSGGEAFLDPRAEIRAHLSLSKEASWTVNGVVLPASPGRGRTRPALSRRLRGLSRAAPTLRVLAFRNGAGSEGCEVAAAGPVEQFLDLCTLKLQLTSTAQLLYDWEGNRVQDIGLVPLLDGCLQGSATPLRGPVWVSRGEWFSPAGAKVYIQGALRALRGKLRPAAEYLAQVNFALENNREKVWKKEILSMTVKELYEAREKARSQVEELRASLRKHRAQLAALGPLIRAEEERPGGYVSQHVRPLQGGPPLPQGLQLKVYEIGRASGETLVFVNMAEVDKGCREDAELSMERLLQVIHQRLQARGTGGPCGPRSVPTRLFDERGEAVSSPALLRNEQAVWVSYGEDYRPPRQAVLALAFERAVAAGEEDYRDIFRAPLDPDAELPAGFRKWEAWEGFPPNCVPDPPGSTRLADRADPHAHFIQLKADPQVVLVPSAEVVYRTGPAGSKLAGGTGPGTEWPLSHVWVVTKAGWILSRVLPQLCLAVSSQPITLTDGDGAPAEAFPLNVQKRVRGCPDQEWSFGKDGCIFPRARPEFVLTFLNVPCGATHDSQGAREAGRQKRDAQAERSGHADPPVDPPALGEGAQPTVALLRRRGDKHPRASAQRWAIRQEGVGRCGQWKHSKVENPLWNKLTYMWPTLPDGELNQDLAWPLEGALVACAPPLTDASRRPLDRVPMRLRVLRNGQQGGSAQAVTVTAPDTANMLKTRRKSQPRPRGPRAETDRGNTAQDDDRATKIHKLQFQQFLERCTGALGLPRAARRLFDQDGQEVSLLTGLQRDQLVYASCGEQWADPRLRQADRKRRVLLSGLEQDAALVRHYCATRHHQDLVLEAVGELTDGAQLTVSECCVSPGETSKESSNQEPTSQDTNENTDEDLLNMLKEDSHSRAHRKLDEKHQPFRYPWQQNLELSEDGGIQNDKEESSTKMLVQRQRRVTQAQLQQFEFREGQIVSCQSPELALGVRSTEGARAGMALQLLTRNPDDTNQRWILRDEDQTLRLLANPGLVLAVSMSKITPGHTGAPIPIPGCPVILQKHKPYSHGAANQRWGWLPEVPVLSAFFTSELDQAVTAALRACLCTACVTPEPLHQQGYFLLSSGGTRKVEVCSTCAKILRGKHVLQELPTDSVFRCSTVRRDTALNPHGPFKILTVCKTDLGDASAAEGVLRGLEERLESLRAETRPRGTAPPAPGPGSAPARAQPAARILAHRNGWGLRGGQLITAATVPLMLSQCTLKLQLSRAASRLYTADGTQILSVPQLKAWAINECLQEHCAAADTAAQPADPTAQPAEPPHADPPHTDPLHAPDADSRGRPGYEPLPQVTAEDLDAVDEDLQALILRSPVDVWVSCGEPFIPVEVVQRRQGQRWRSWLQKEKLLAELLMKKHKMRHLQGRRIAGQSLARMVPTLSPAQPVVVEGGWTQASLEELELKEDLQNMETHLAAVEASRVKNRAPVPSRQSRGLQDLYNQPDVKRVLAYRNGDPKRAAYVWGRSIEELLSNSGSRLGLSQPAACLYGADGGPLRSWAEVQRDMLVCVSAGGPFLTAEDCREKIEMRARYARAKKSCGPGGILLELETQKGPTTDVNTPGRWLALPWGTEAENQIPVMETQ
ncbi:doublecortin domain-containing protein 1-like isoform X2 [Anguilla rostrata]|uniref:doublecortin domain-containing protein 1-like isoform X2 n=1 Tax=Anguilla rostrata TaxID=7938 RepID=UPI0030D3E5E2